MIAFALSNFLGGLLSVIPDVMKEVRDSRNHGRELEHMEKLAEIQQKTASATADSKMREIEGNAYVEEIKTTRETMLKILESAAKPTGFPWIDAFNALQRPLMTTAVTTLMYWISINVILSLNHQLADGQIDAIQYMKLIEQSFIGTMIEGVLGYFLGYRTAAKKPAAF